MRYPTIQPEDMSVRQQEVAAAIAQRRPEGFEGPYLALIQAPEVAVRVQRLDDHLRFNLRLPERLRVVAMLVSAGRHRAEDIQPFAALDATQHSGLAADTLAALSAGHKPADMQADEAVVYEFASQVIRTGHVTSELFDRAEKLLGKEKCLEVVEVCGFTAFMSKVINVTQRSFGDQAK
jgi:4-carboxymuconolactone decarboxylase